MALPGDVEIHTPRDLVEHFKKCGMRDRAAHDENQR